MADYIPEWGAPVSEAVNQIVAESVKAREVLVNTPKYVVRMSKTYLKNMSCDVINTEHRTYSDEGKLLCVTIPASLVAWLVAYVEEEVGSSCGDSCGYLAHTCTREKEGV